MRDGRSPPAEGGQPLAAHHSLFSQLALGDVGRRPKPFTNLPIRVDQRNRPREGPSGRSVRAKNPVFQFEGAFIVSECESAKSFRLVSADADPLYPHLPGQHLPLRLKIRGQRRAVFRCYTIQTMRTNIIG